MANYQSKKIKANAENEELDELPTEEPAQEELETGTEPMIAEEAPKKSGFWAKTAEKKRGQEFETADVLQIVTGKMLGTEGYDSVFDLMSYMTGIRIDSISYPDALDVCRKEILAQYPKLARCAYGGERYEFDPEDTDLWLAYRRKEFGDSLTIEKLNDIDAQELHETVEMKLRAMNPKKRKPKVGAID